VRDFAVVRSRGARARQRAGGCGETAVRAVRRSLASEAPRAYVTSGWPQAIPRRNVPEEWYVPDAVSDVNRGSPTWGGWIQELSLSSEAEIGERLRRLANRMGRTSPEKTARYDELMAVHDELIEILADLRRQIEQSGSP
jgi:hypothetical protein